MSDQLSGVKILIVDDHPVTLSLLRQVLKQLGFKNIQEAEDGERALALIRLEDIKLVFTDLNMPSMSGHQLIQEIRQQAATRHLPVIVVSGESSQEQVTMALREGADTFVVKPFTAKIIKEKIVQVLSRKTRPTPPPIETSPSPR
jgi:two-component system chemotaxis response regulator CheY